MSKDKNFNQDNTDLFNKISQITSEIFTYQITMMATGAVAQPLISPILKASLETGINQKTYRDAQRIIVNLSREEMLQSIKIGYQRRVIAAIPPVAILTTTQNHAEINPFLSSIASATISTGLSIAARNIDAAESIGILNAGKTQEEIEKRAKIANQPKNISTTRSLLFARNVVYSIAIFCSDSLAKEFCDQNKEVLIAATGLNEKDLQSGLSYIFRFSSCAATTPLQNLFASFACGTVENFSKEMFQPKNLFRGSLARASALMVAIESFNQAKKISKNIFEGEEIFQDDNFLNNAGIALAKIPQSNVDETKNETIETLLNKINFQFENFTSKTLSKEQEDAFASNILTTYNKAKIPKEIFAGKNTYKSINPVYNILSNETPVKNPETKKQDADNFDQLIKKIGEVNER